jgi:hypothetical protein
MSKKARIRSKSAALIPGLAIILLLGVAVQAPAQYNIYDLGFNVRAQDIRADNSNTVHIVWVDRGILYYGKIVNNDVSGKVQVATGVETAMWRPYVSVRPDGGSVHVAWTTGGFGNMLMHSWKTTGGWTTEQVLSVPSTQKLSQATCAIDSSGILHMMFVIWNNVPSNDWATVFYMRKLANSNWESKQKFIPYDVEYKHPLLINDSQGRIHATWTLQGRYGSDVFEAYYCMAPGGGKLSYTDMIKIPKAPGCDVNGYGELYVDRYGVVHRTIGGWSNAEQKMCLDHAKKPVGAGFETPTRPSLGYLYVATDPMPVVVASEDGQAIVAWGEIGSDGSNTVKASFYDPDKGSWSLYTIDPAAGIPMAAYSYRVAMTRTDTHVFGVWRGGNGHLKLFVLPIEANIKNDFNKDGKIDILWRNYANGANIVTYMDGVEWIGKAPLPTEKDINWTIGGTGDFNGDGKVDILWRNNESGSNMVWYLDGVTKIGNASLPPLTNTNWKIGGTGDFNGDGKVDILWRNYGNGSNAVSYMDGVTQIGTASLPRVADTNWKIEGTGDFNSDGKVDILWRNYGNGSNMVWYMDGATQIGTGSLPGETDIVAEIAGSGDFNSDGKADILWRHYGTGSNWIWYMDGVRRIASESLPTVTNINWRIENK